MDLMNPMQTCSSMNSQRALSSDCESEYNGPTGGEVPSSRLILRLYGQCGARVSAFILLKTSAKSWYYSGILERSSSLLDIEVAFPYTEVSER